VGDFKGRLLRQSQQVLRPRIDAQLAARSGRVSPIDRDTVDTNWWESSSSPESTMRPISQLCNLSWPTARCVDEVGPRVVVFNVGRTAGTRRQSAFAAP
jgi:hypothetical protein